MELSALAHDAWLMGLLALLMGARHGFDADHIAAVDALTRCASVARARAARWSGALFSLGHGGVIVLVAALATWLVDEWPVPGWLDTAGVAISVSFLLALGTLNLLAVLRTPVDQPVALVGLRARWLGRVIGDGGAWVAAGVGALFALSFDALSQASVFAVAGRQAGGDGFPVLLALLFTAGMMLTDGANGLWVSRLLRSADERALRASRVLGLAVAALSYAVAALGIARFASPALAAWSEGREAGFGALAVCLLLLVFLAAMRLSPSARPCPVPSGIDAPGTSTPPGSGAPSLRSAP